jgi:hypothetical protein
MTETPPPYGTRRGGPPPVVPGQPGQPPYQQPPYQQPYWGVPPYFGAQPGYGYPPPPQPLLPIRQYSWGGPAPVPGVVPMRPLALAEVLDGSYAIIREYPGVTLGLAAIVVTITQLVAFVVSLLNRNDAAAQGLDAVFHAFGPLPMLSLVISSTGVLVLAGMLAPVVGDAVLGRRSTISGTWAKVRPRFWVLLLAGFVGSVVQWAGFLMCLLPGAFIWGAWSFLSPVVVLERAGLGTGIKRSWRLAVPDWFRVFGIRALAVIIGAVIQAIVVIPVTIAVFGSLNGDFSRGSLGIGRLAILAAGGIVAGTITAPFTSGVLALLYLDRRMRTEALDVTLAQAAAAGTA